ncbi:MAG: ribonuclease R [Clostridia bacterium]|nr:ribonuclease R [Clostridia bacterium]
MDKDFYDIVLEQIKKNKLENYDKAFVIKQLCVLNNKTYDEMASVVNTLYETKEISLKGGNVQIDAPISPFAMFDKKLSKRERHRQEVKAKTKESKKEKATQKRMTAKVNEESKIYQDEEPSLNKPRLKLHSKVTGKIQGTTKGYAFLIPDDINLPDVFINEGNLNGAMHNDKVVVFVTNVYGEKADGEVVQVLERGSEKIVGQIHYEKTCAWVKPDDVKFGKDICVGLKKTLGAEEGDKVYVRIEKFYASKRNPDGIVVEVLGKPNTIETEVKAILRSHNLFEGFPKKVKAYCEECIPESINKEEYKNRVDLTDKLIFTIDGEDTRDIDDAISLEINEKGNRVLGVHIADVGEYVKQDNEIDKEAFKRGTSVYFPSLVLPMLPQELSNGICSLNERVDRLALSVFMEYDENANVISHKICESIINSKKRYTYTEVMAIIDGNEEVIAKNDPALVDTIIKMNELSHQLIKFRYDRGAINFSIPEVQISLNELGDVLELHKRESNDSHKLIESFMVAANETIAEHFLENKTPFVYRIHEEPDEEKLSAFIKMCESFGVQVNTFDKKIGPKTLQTILEKVAGEPHEYALNKVCLRSMKKAKYSPDCLGHYGLASPKYCHFTSPIRRYPDLTIHRIIKTSLRGEIDLLAKNKLHDFVASSSLQSSEREKVAESAERDVDDLYRVFYMQHHVGEEFEGVISGVTAFGVFVELDNTVEGMIRLENLPTDQYEYFEDRYTLKGYSNKFTLGDRLRVKAVRADILAREVTFEYLSKVE